MSHDETAVLASQVYADAFAKVMGGTDPALLPDAEREALRFAKDLTRAEGAGYPMPTWADPTRPAGAR